MISGVRDCSGSRTLIASNNTTNKTPCLRGIPISGDHKFAEEIKIKVRGQPVTKGGGIVLYGLVRNGDPEHSPEWGPE